MLNKTHLITGWSKIISSENLAKKILVPHFLYTQLYLTPLEQCPFLASYDYGRLQLVTTYYLMV